MKRFTSIIVTITCLTLNVPLAAEQPAVVHRSPDYWYTYAEKLPIGSTVRVRTADGERFTAVLAVVDREGITLEMKTRVPEQPRRVLFGRLAQLELKQNGSSVAKAAAIGVAAGAAAFFGILLIFAAAYAD